MEAISLEELLPEGAEFTLSKLNKTYRLRPFSIEDERWMQGRYGDRIQEIFSKLLTKELTEIVFHQLEPEDQLDFEAQDVTTLDEETGEKSQIRIGGAPLIRQCIHGKTELMSILQALLRTVGISRPVMDKIKRAVVREEDAKKKQTGPQSMTASRTPTAGHSKKSAVARSGKSTRSSSVSPLARPGNTRPSTKGSASKRASTGGS